ncbi:CRASP family complement regulator-acquiring lipoprotein [Borreliella lusitaniae]|uniref:CRASP family complement regulator-acquiring lipoprotein n=1 Tax=Borreliella lusitaniae TaxID=100177 RepID=A0ABZ0CJC3_9SPIR|nr:CRASP family complement regulator-acquiring lipoprotein [Borreliella lusitaniae]WNY69111.1 CRASP family complement regulator-acquiring lipoprotein [Borreliella lusitaniae]
MKYSIIVSIFVCLFLNACNPDVNTNQKNIKHQSSKKITKDNKKKLTPKAEVKPNQEVNPKAEATPNQEEAPKEEVKPNQEVTPKEEAKPNQEVNLYKAEATPNQEEDGNKKTKNISLNDLIKKANTEREKYIKRIDEEPENQYGMWIFKELSWMGEKNERTHQNTERSKKFRKEVYSALYTIDTNQLETVSDIIMKAKEIGLIFNALSTIEIKIDKTIVELTSKKDTLNKLEISDIEKLTNSFEKILSTKKEISDTFKQLLLDYKNDTNNIKTNTNELKSHVINIHNQILEKKEKEIDTLQDEIISPLIKKL